MQHPSMCKHHEILAQRLLRSPPCKSSLGLILANTTALRVLINARSWPPSVSCQCPSALARSHTHTNREAEVQAAGT